MRRTLFALLAASALLLSGSAEAAPLGIGVADPVGDWTVPWQDITAANLALGPLKGGQRQLTMSLTMAADVATGTSGMYEIAVGSSERGVCRVITARLRIVQPYQLLATSRETTSPCEEKTTPAVFLDDLFSNKLGEVGGAPVAAVVGGRTVTFSLVAPAWVAPHRTLTFASRSHPNAWLSADDGGGPACTCDLAGLVRPWIVP